MPTDQPSEQPLDHWDRMIAGELYLADDPRIDALARRAVMLCAEHRAAFEANDDVRAREVLTELIGNIGEDAVIRAPIMVDFGSHITVGPRTFINFNFTALDVAPIVIGADCLIGPNVQLLTPSHPIEPGPRRDKWERAESITLEDNVWLGGGVTVCPGVTIGENSVVGAGSVVTRDLGRNVVAVGNPARVIRAI